MLIDHHELFLKVTLCIFATVTRALSTYQSPQCSNVALEQRTFIKVVLTTVIPVALVNRKGTCSVSAITLFMTSTLKLLAYVDRVFAQSCAPMSLN